MLQSRSVLAIVPARGGSKRVVGKNKRMIGGFPLISWTLRACLQSNFIDQVIVSTDDPEISEISERAGVSRIHRRSNNLASDQSPTMDTVLDILLELESETLSFDIIFLAQPTSPMRTADHIDAALDLLIEKEAASIIGVTESAHPREWQAPLAQDGDMRPFLSQTRLNQASHLLPKNYVVNGAIYIASRETLLKEKTFFTSENIFAFFMSPRDSIDIDTELDFEIAEYLLSTRGT